MPVRNAHRRVEQTSTGLDDAHVYLDAKLRLAWATGTR
jgi:hypothetical protein